MKRIAAGFLAGLVLSGAVPAWSQEAPVAAISARQSVEIITQRDLPPSESPPQVTIRQDNPAPTDLVAPVEATITDRDLFPNAGEPIESLINPPTTPSAAPAADPERPHRKKRRRARRHHPVVAGKERRAHYRLQAGNTPPFTSW